MRYPLSTKKTQMDLKNIRESECTESRERLKKRLSYSLIPAGYKEGNETQMAEEDTIEEKRKAPFWGLSYAKETRAN